MHVGPGRSAAGPRAAACLSAGVWGQTGVVSMIGAPARRLALVAVVAAVLAIVLAAVMVAWLLSDADNAVEPSPDSSGITLNTSSWDGGYGMEAVVGGIVRVDADGCVYLDGFRPGVVSNVVWPAGYTATRRADGTVTISNPGGVVVAATGHRLRASGGERQPGVDDLDCAAEDSIEAAVMITDVLPPLNGPRSPQIGR